MKRPTVSVIIPTYNRAETLPRAMDSVIAQLFQDWEMVVVDDGSTDATPQLLDKYQTRLGDKLITVRQHNRGCGAARNRGIDLCRGQFVAFLDSDDEFLPHKLARQLELFAACPELAFVYSDYSFVDLEGRRTLSALTSKFPIAQSVPFRMVGHRLHAVGRELFESLLRGYFIATIVGLVRREALGEVRFDERLSYAEEWLFYLQLARAGRAGFVNEPLALHHFTKNSLTRTDKLRNLTRQCELFRAMKEQLSGLSRHEEATVNGHLARAHAQLARQLRTTGHPARAMGSTAKSWFYSLKMKSDRSGSTESGDRAADQVRCLPAR